MIVIKQKGDFKRSNKYFDKLTRISKSGIFERYAEKGLAALRANTPKDTGKTADSWYYEIENQNGNISILFCNSYINNNVQIAIILQYGHGTGTGGWVEGIDYINPALKPVFEQLSNELWEEVNNI